jgi:hypothetical protein
MRALSSGSGGIASVVVALGLFGAAVWSLSQLGGPGRAAGRRAGAQPRRKTIVPQTAARQSQSYRHRQRKVDADALFERAAETPVASITSVEESRLKDTADADRAADGLPGLGDFISSKISAVDEAALEPSARATPATGPGAASMAARTPTPAWCSRPMPRCGCASRTRKATWS